MLKSIQLIFGFYPRRILRSLSSLSWYRRSRKEFKRQTKEKGTPFPITSTFPCLTDRYEEGGAPSKHYYYQDLLIAQYIFKSQPKTHVDIGSRIDGFVAHVASFREIEVIDIRILTSNIDNIKFLQADMMNPIADSHKCYCDSISSLHAVEHFGLGRYGDPIDPEGYLKGLNNMYDMLQTGGTFYFSVPIGPQRVEFNAHRVFSVSHLLELFSDRYNLKAFSYVDDKGDLHKEVAMDENKITSNFGCNYGCGIFTLTKK